MNGLLGRHELRRDNRILPTATHTSKPPPPARRSISDSRPTTPLARFAACAEACTFALTRAPMLTHWEFDFLRNVAGFSKLSRKQLDTLRRLVTRAIAAGGRP